MHYHGITQIRASAGSGKTYSLTSLCIDLLAKSHIEENDSYENVWSTDTIFYTWMDIVAMTFTNKAALHMKEDCIFMLKKIALGKENPRELMDSDKANTIFTKIVPHYDKLHFRTIDSFLLQILRSSSINIGLPRHFDIVLNATQEEEIITNAYNTFVEEAKDTVMYQDLLEKSWRFFLRDTSIAFGSRAQFQERLFPVIKDMLRKGYFLPENMQDLSFIHEYQETVSLLYKKYSSASLKRIIEAKVKLLNVYLTEDKQIPSLDARATKAFMSGGFTKEGSVSAYLTKSLLRECYKKNTQPPSEKAEELYKEILYSVYLYKILSKSVDEAYRIAPLVELAQYIIQNIYTYQKKHSLVLFSTVPRLIESVFNQVRISETLYKMGSKIRHVLLDEFQDTSREQWNAMYPLFYEILSHGGSLTYVGDTKQSLYGWRGADPRLFEAIIDMFHTNVEQKTLEFNWRSAEPIVTFNNIFSLMENEIHAQAMLSSLFTQKNYEYIAKEYPDILEDAIAELATAYSNSVQKVSKNTVGKKGCVQIVEVYEKDPKVEQEKYASRMELELHARILTVLKEYNPKDIAILIRTNKEAEEIAILLAQWNIPYATEGNVYLKDSKIVQAILSFLRIIEDPLNERAFCSVVCSKIILYSLLGEKKIYDWLTIKRSIPLYQAFKKDFAIEWKRCFSPFYSMTSKCAYEYVQRICKYFQLYERYPHERIVLDSLLEVIYSAGNSGIRSIMDFIEYWEKDEDTFIIGESSSSAVTICTIHKSKGLEYPVVIIPYKEGNSKHTSDILPITVEELLPKEEYILFEGITDIPLLIRGAKEHKIYYQGLASRIVESVNTMYVAYTRAKSELYILLPKKMKENSEYSSSAGALEWILEQEELSLFSKHVQKDSYGETHTYEYSTKEKEERTSINIPERLVKEYPYKAMEIKDIDIISSWMPSIKVHQKVENSENTSISAVKRGEILHKVVSSIDSLDTKGLKHIIDRVLAEYRLSSELYTTLYNDISQRVQWFFSREDLAIYIKKGIVERDILYKEGVTIHRVRPDKIVSTSDNIYSIIEYKTGKKEAKHKDQVEKYMSLFQSIKKGKVEGVIIYFDEEEVVTMGYIG